MEVLFKRNGIYIIRQLIHYDVKFNYNDKQLQALFSNNWHNARLRYGYSCVFFFISFNII